MTNTANSQIRIDKVTKEFTVSQRKSALKRDSRKITALRNIDFSVNKGEFIGIVGANGSGKTTLLRIIANILKPTYGNVYVSGKALALLEMGVGFHEDLTLKENIFLYGALIGLEKKCISAKIDKITGFAGLEEYTNAEFRSLSQGMKMRLAFSTIVFSEPDIFLLDEALAVGDADFQAKCYDFFRGLKEQKKTLFLATHSLNEIGSVCDKVLLLDKGRQVEFGDTKEVLRHYKTA